MYSRKFYAFHEYMKVMLEFRISASAGLSIRAIKYKMANTNAFHSQLISFSQTKAAVGPKTDGSQPQNHLRAINIYKQEQS